MAAEVIEPERFVPAEKRARPERRPRQDAVPARRARPGTFLGVDIETATRIYDAVYAPPKPRAPSLQEEVVARERASEKTPSPAEKPERTAAADRPTKATPQARLPVPARTRSIAPARELGRTVRSQTPRPTPTEQIEPLFDKDALWEGLESSNPSPAGSSAFDASKARTGGNAKRRDFPTGQRQRRRAPRTGADAAAAFRHRARVQAVNRLTPVRAAGWALWAGTLAAVAIGLGTFRPQIEEMWPRASFAYAAVLGVPAAQPGLRVVDVESRYALSTHGPVLELRGRVVNDAQEQKLPALWFVADGPNGALTKEPVHLTDVPLPRGGERPFIIRAQIPEGANRAELRLASAVGTGAGQSFVLQRTGSGWGEALPPIKR